MKKATPRVELFNKSAAREHLPKISPQDHKSSRGRCLLFAGSGDYPGAGVLAARGALRGGSGYVTLAQRHIATASLENPDFLLLDLQKKSWQDQAVDAVLIGPGFGINSDTAELLKELKTKCTTVVVDADAITVCAKEDLFPLPPQWIATPHAGELSRCLGWTVEEIAQNRLGAVLAGQKKLGCTVLLKGHGTLVTDGQRVVKIASGNAALAKAGTGDILAGLITAFRAQGLDAISAASLGAYVHGATANLWVARKLDPLAMTASDVLDLLPRVLYLLRLAT